MEKIIYRLEDVCDEWEYNLMLDYCPDSLSDSGLRHDISKVFKLIKRVRKIIKMLGKLDSGCKWYERIGGYYGYYK